MFHTIDLNFQKQKKNIASFAIPVQQNNQTKWILFETGPYSCHSSLVVGLKEKGIDIQDVIKVFLTHIHLDHSGGAWKLAELGADIYVHPFGAPFLINPEKLIQSASRIYGEKMETLWSTIKGIDENKVFAIEDGKSFTFTNPSGKEFVVKAHHTPGHANHHIAWQVGKILFAGDVLGIRIDNNPLDIPAPPPEFHPELWLESVAKIRKLKLEEVALTHFGSFKDVDHHLERVENRIWEIIGWFRGQMRSKVTRKEIEKNFQIFIQENHNQNDIEQSLINKYPNINPSFMTVMGILRYLKKYENLTLEDE